MIYGIGVDIVEIQRMQDALDRQGEKLAQRILTSDELVEFQQQKNPAIFLAKRFAVKEAAAKAFGTGFSDGLQHQHIGVIHDEKGKPQLIFFDIAQEWLVQRKIMHTHLSISDEKNMAIAYVVFESNVG